MIHYKDMAMMMGVLSMGGIALFFTGFLIANKFILIFGIGFASVSVIISIYCGFKSGMLKQSSITTGEER